MMMKSGLGKIFWKYLHVLTIKVVLEGWAVTAQPSRTTLLTMSFLLVNFDQKYKFSDKNNMGRVSLGHSIS